MTPSLAAHGGRLLRYVLEDLHYPARWWEIMAMADMYGLAASNRTELGRLPRQLYGSFEDVLSALLDGHRGIVTALPARRASREGRDCRPSTVRTRPMRGQDGHRRR
jgi:hypothetical protein